MNLRDWADDPVVKVYERYEQRFKAANAVDFDDLILRRARASREDPTARRRRACEKSLPLRPGRRVPGHQPASSTASCGSSSRDARRTCASSATTTSRIYRWRGADVRNIRGFRQDFPDAEVVKLEQNYRSTARIVRAALGVIKPRRRPRAEGALDRQRRRRARSRRRLRPTSATRRRSSSRASASSTREGVSPKDIAVFYRIHAQSRVLEEALRAVNIPYQIVGGHEFFERAEVKDVLAYLRVLANPRSDVDLLAHHQHAGARHRQHHDRRLRRLRRRQQTSRLEALERCAEFAPSSAPRRRKKLARFRELMQRSCEQRRTRRPSDAAQLRCSTKAATRGLEDEDTAEAEARLENLAELVGSIIDYEAEAQAAARSRRSTATSSACRSSPTSTR